jgi:hypothetical protein
MPVPFIGGAVPAIAPFVKLFSDFMSLKKCLSAKKYAAKNSWGGVLKKCHIQNANAGKQAKPSHKNAVNILA